MQGITSDWFRARRAGETKALLRADVVLAIQGEEAASFERFLLGRRLVVVCGHIVDVARTAHHLPDSHTVGFIGSFNAIDSRSLAWFLRYRWPEIKERVPGVRMVVAGTVGREIDLENVNDPHLEVRPSVERLDEFYSNMAVVINPVVKGTGLKIKSMRRWDMGARSCAHQRELQVSQHWRRGS